MKKLYNMALAAFALVQSCASIGITRTTGINPYSNKEAPEYGEIVDLNGEASLRFGNCASLDALEYLQSHNGETEESAFDKLTHANGTEIRFNNLFKRSGIRHPVNFESKKEVERIFDGRHYRCTVNELSSDDVRDLALATGRDYSSALKWLFLLADRRD